MLPFICNFPFFSIFLTIIAALVIMLVRRPLAAWRITMCSLAATVGMSLAVLWQTYLNGPFNYTMGHFPAPWGNELRAGALEGLMAAVLTLVIMLSLLGGRHDLRGDVREDKQHQYLAEVLLLTSSILALIYTNDLFTAYVFIEINALSACAIVAARDNGKATIATIHYMIYNSVGSGLLLLGIAILYRCTGNLLMESLHESITALSSAVEYRLSLILALGLIVIGIALKSALFPFYNWLPGAHGNATTASSAILSGVVLKGYIVLLVKVIFRVYSLELANEYHILDGLFVLGLLGMIIGSVRAMFQTDAKRMAAFSTVAQIGYIYMALGLGSAAGAVAACLQIIAHSVTKAMIFCSLGRLSGARGHAREWIELRGSARQRPLAGVLFCVGGLSMCGIPLLAGFGVKYAIAQTALVSQTAFLVTALLLGLSSVLNALYYVPAMLNIWTAPDGPMPEAERSRDGSFAVSSVCFLILSAALGVCFVPLLGLINSGLGML